MAFTVHRKTDLRIPAIASLHSSSPAFLICWFIFLFLPLVHCKADISHRVKFQIWIVVTWACSLGGWLFVHCKMMNIVYLLFVYSRFIYEKKWVYSINLYRLNHYDRISYADVENVNEHHVLSFVTDAYVFSGFLPVVFSNSALMTSFCLFSFHRSHLGRWFSCRCCRHATSGWMVVLQWNSKILHI